MKSFEFLIAVGLLTLLFAPLYKVAKYQAELLNKKLNEFNESVTKRGVNSIVQNMKAYGAPFSYDGFGDFSPKDSEDLTYNPLTDSFTYITYSRW